MLSILLNFLSFAKSESSKVVVVYTFNPNSIQCQRHANLSLRPTSPTKQVPKQPKTHRKTLSWRGAGGGIQTKREKSETSSPMLTIRYHPPKSRLFFCCKIIHMHYYAHLTPYQSYINTELYILELLILPPKSWEYTGVKPWLNCTFLVFTLLFMCVRDCLSPVCKCPVRSEDQSCR